MRCRGRRVRYTTVHVFSGSKVVAEYANGSLSKEYVYSGGSLLATIAGSTTTYHNQDQLSVRLSTDSTGSVVSQQGHYPFGEAWYSDAGSTKWKFTSYERDSESGNDYAIFRYYQNRLGRFSSPDPVAGSVHDPQSVNRFAYVGNDPVNLMDPMGLEPCYIDGLESAPVFCRMLLSLEGGYPGPEASGIVGAGPCFRVGKPRGCPTLIAPGSER